VSGVRPVGGATDVRVVGRRVVCRDDVTLAFTL
jgi:hypothetical protein